MPPKQNNTFEPSLKKPSLTGIALLTAIGLNALSPLPVRAAGIIVVNSNADVVADDGLCTLREAILNANTDSQLYGTSGECAAGSAADEIIFAGTVFNSAANISLLSGELHISTDLTISGPGDQLLTINANGNSRGFSIYDSDFNTIKTVKISGITITNGDVGLDSGGGISNFESLELDDVTISNSSAATGGGLYATLPANTTLKIQNSTLSGNVAENAGGGLFVYGTVNNSNINLDNVLISGNNSPQSGGLFIYGYRANITLTDTTITGNTATDEIAGASISTWASTTVVSNCTVSDNTLSGNKSNLNIAGLFFQSSSGTTSLTGSTITNNTTINTAATPSLVGGGLGISVNGNQFLLKNSIIDGNSVSSTAAGYGVGGGAVIESGNLSQITIENIQVTNNTSTHQGGGLYIKTYLSTVSMKDSTISGNQSGHLGGGIMVRNEQYGIFTLEKSSISGNTAEEDGAGIAVFNRYLSETKIINSTISGNTSQAGGGGIFLSSKQNSLLEINHSTIFNNQASIYGGGISGLNDATVELKNSILAGNTVTSGNPDLYIDNYSGSTFNLKYTLVGNNTGTGLTEAPVGSPDGNGNLIGGPINGFIDPLLGSLAENKHPDGDGSRTLSHALLSGSPALDAVPLAACVLTEDQRGVPRPQGEVCDMGALEAAPFFVFMPLTLR